MTDHGSHNSLGPPAPTSPRRGSIQTNISTGTGISGSSSIPTAGSLVTNLTSIDSTHSLKRSELESISAESPAVHYGILSPPSIPRVTPFIKNPPHSRTAIARLTYELEDLPTLFVANVQTLSGRVPPGAWDHVKHQKLRYEAIKELLSTPGIEQFSADIAICQDSMTTKDRVVTPLSVGKTVLFEQLKPQRIELTTIVKRGKGTEAGPKTTVDLPIACEILASSDVLGDEEKAELYFKSLLALLRKRATQIESQGSDCINPEFVQALPASVDHPNKIDPFAGKDQKIDPEFGSGVSLGLRIKPSFNIEHKRLHLDFDVVAHVSKGRLHEALFAIFGKTNLLASPADYLELLRELLPGIQVRCAYTPSDTTSLGLDERATLLDHSNLHKGRSFRIKDVKLPQEVPSFNESSTQHSACSYFNKRVLPRNQTLMYTQLPLVSDGRDHWVPLELLGLEHSQAIMRIKPLLRAAKVVGQSVLSSIHERKIREIGQDFLDRLNVGSWDMKLFETAEKVVFVSNIGGLPHLSKEKPTKKTRAMTFPAERVRVGLIEELSTSSPRSDTELVKKVQDGLLSDRINEPSYMFINKRHAHVDDTTNIETKAKTRSTLLHNNLCGTKDDNKPQLVLGLVTKSNDCARKLQTHVDGLGGPVLVNARMHHLRTLFQGSRFNKEYFPLNLLLKFNFMLGGRNFDINVLDLSSGKNLTHLMIVGAHIRKPTSGRSAYCPSVAAVVASTDKTALQFPGSAHIQQTFVDYYPGTNNKGRGEMKGQEATAIRRLHSMMKERFAAWSDQDNPPTSVLFYRDSINFDDSSLWHDIDGIKQAHHDTWPGQKESPKITFLVFNKNAQHTPVPIQFSSRPEPDKYEVPVVPQLDFDTVVEGPKKHKYYVITNEIELTTDELRELTINLNKSSQMSSQTDQVAKALPLLWAKKLSSRVYERFADSFKDKQDEPFEGSETHDMRQMKIVAEVWKRFGLDVNSGAGDLIPKDFQNKMFYL